MCIDLTEKNMTGVLTGTSLLKTVWIQEKQTDTFNL